MFSIVLYELCLAFRFDILTEMRGYLCGMFIYSSEIIPIPCNNLLGPVVQSWASTNPGLKFNPMFKFLSFYTSVYSKTLGL